MFKFDSCKCQNTLDSSKIAKKIIKSINFLTILNNITNKLL